ncbi:TonB-dependent receptor [Aurantiacibacter gangjinensis]|uniref:TonB-dependent receptor n=1 Tax=Aurantiacibacter gangjinensis TaxID=502682 RepID=A0A0G9MKE7_9SPHN|nr:TonB-dependent receptor [Aurantiacibacter gangjinensis]
MRTVFFRAALLAGATALAPLPALADTVDSTDNTEGADLTDPDGDRDYLPGNIVVTGTAQGYGEDDGSTGMKTETPIIDVPQTVTFITDDQLEDQSIRQLGEALRFVPGISLETGEGHRDEIFIRGQETTADFYLDGLRDDAQYYRPLYNVARIEVLKGANALIFGRGGGGGVVNRVANRASLNGFSGELDSSVDTFGAWAIVGGINAPVSDSVAFRVDTTYEQFDNNRDFYDGHFFGIAPTLTAELGPDTRLFAFYSYDNDERLVDRGNPADGDGPLRGFQDTLFGAGDFNDTEVHVHIARTRLEHDFSEALSANVTLQYADYDKGYQNILPRGLRNGGTDVEFSGYRDEQTRENFIAQANLVANFSTGSIGHTLMLGVEGSWQDSFNGRANAFFDDGAGGLNSRVTLPLAQTFTFPAISLGAPVRDRHSELEVFSAYIQDQIAIGENLELIAGLRFDRFDLQTEERLTSTSGDRVDEVFSPRFGIVYQPSDMLSLYASYAESFLPQAGDQFFLLPPSSEAFEPEKFTNYEVGVKYAPTAELLLTAAIFQVERTNTRGPDPADPTVTALVGESRVRGFEASVAGNITDAWSINFGYTYLDGEITETSTFGAAGLTLQQLAEHQVSAWTRLQATDRLGFGLGAIWQDEQFASFSNDVVLPDYLRVDAAVFFDLTDTIALQANVENLFDADYFPSAHGDNNLQPGEPLNVRFGARLRF